MASTWDDTIVPALRKRLESESRILAKRMSIASVDDAQQDTPPEPRKSSAIPRPSPRVNGASPPRRTRTVSQPPSPPPPPCNPLPTPDSSRPTSPRTSDVRPTRIPIAARARTASASSKPRPIPEDPPAAAHHQPAPPAPVRARTVPVHPRPSNDSDERPFEHWYRGDVHRNGGVGELRVAKHLEMLQIANYGHNLRKAARGAPPAPLASPRMRRRADSVGIGTHESFYLDDDNDAGMVLDEAPLTDMDTDHDTEAEQFYDAYTGVDTELDDATLTAFAPRLSFSRSHTPANVRAPTITDDLLRTSTSSGPPRSSAESNLPNATLPTRTPRATSPISQSSDQSFTKRRAKSPAASSVASTPKKARTTVKTPPPSSRKDDPRISIATYPTPEGNVVDAIPSWTQPVQKTGNWDEASVVLPVVARKRGLDSQYEQVDGTPRSKSPEAPIKPAPGTFGYDYTKYRPPRVSEDIQMAQFGRIPEDEPIPEEHEALPLPQPSPKPSIRPHVTIELHEPVREDPRKTVAKSPESPLPFSRYRIEQQPVPTISVQRPSTEIVDRQHADDDFNAGCCRCVIM